VNQRTDGPRFAGYLSLFRQETFLFHNTMSHFDEDYDERIPNQRRFYSSTFRATNPPLLQLTSVSVDAEPNILSLALVHCVW